MVATVSSFAPDVAAVRDVARCWAAAVEAQDAEALGRLMCEDVVIIHGNGCQVAGREAVILDFTRSFETVHVRQRIEFEETIISGDWAFDRATVYTTITPRDGSATNTFASRTFTILRREASGEWRVARAMGVIEQ